MATSDAFQKLKSSVNRGITTISVKTSSGLEKTKIKTHIESLNREIEKELLAVGEAAYKIWKTQSGDYSSLDAGFRSIDDKHAQISELTAQYNSIDERDSRILGNSAETTDTKIFCAQCGTQYDEPVNFCRKCGNKMNG